MVKFSVRRSLTNIYGKKRVYSVSKFPMGNVFHFPFTLYFERSFVRRDTTLNG